MHGKKHGQVTNWRLTKRADEKAIKLRKWQQELATVSIGNEETKSTQAFVPYQQRIVDGLI